VNLQCIDQFRVADVDAGFVCCVLQVWGETCSTLRGVSLTIGSGGRFTVVPYRTQAKPAFEPRPVVIHLCCVRV
jgi:hypothetical protein